MTIDFEKRIRGIVSESIRRVLSESHCFRFEDDGNRLTFYLGGEECGLIDYRKAYVDGICSEYEDSVDDFNSRVLSVFDDNLPIVNIEYVYLYNGYRGNGLFREMLSLGIKYLKGKYKQFILRACPDNGFPQEKLVQLYGAEGFVPRQETEVDGTIMTLVC